MELTDIQKNFLVRLKGGPLHYDILGDYYANNGGDERAKKELYNMSKYGYVMFNGSEASLTQKGFDIVKNQISYKLP